MKIEQKEIIKDMRPKYGTQIEISEYRARFAGSPITDLLKDESDARQKHLYKIVQGNMITANIALTEQDFERVNEILNPIDFTRVNSTVNGNSRFACHFLAFITPQDAGSIDSRYSLALTRAKQFGGRKFHNKQYGGGIVFEMYDGERLKMSAKIREYLKTLKA